MLLSCGSNSFSHLALSHNEDVTTLTETVPPPEGDIVDLVSVSAHTLVLVRHANRNAVYGIGTNTVGQLGTPCALRDEDDKQVVSGWRRLELVRELRTALKEADWEPVKIGATWTTTFVVYRKTVSAQGSVDEKASTPGEEMIVACGSSDFNELGYTDMTSPGGSGMVEAFPHPRVVQAGVRPDETVDFLACGQRHIVLVVSSGEQRQRVIGWGAGRRGELDISTLGGSSSAQQPTSSKGKGKAPARSRTYPPTELHLPLEQDERIIDVALGASHAVALTSQNRVLAWGSDQKGQINDTANLGDIKQIAVTWGGSYFLTTDGRILSQGSNIYGQLLHEGDSRAEVDAPKGWRVERIVAGSEHLLAVLKNQDALLTLWSGGWNEHGNLALGDQIDRPKLERVQVPAGSIKGVWGGCASTWVSLDA